MKTMLGTIKGSRRDATPPQPAVDPPLLLFNWLNPNSEMPTIIFFHLWQSQQWVTLFFLLIVRPMDLSTIKKNIESGVCILYNDQLSTENMTLYRG
jgi:hypothetical protein